MKIILLLFSLFAISIYSQNSEYSINKDFEKAVKAYNAGEYETASNLFKSIVKKKEFNSKQSVSAFFVAKICSDQKQNDKAVKSINEFLTKYPQSKYADEVKNLLIKCYLDMKDYQNAFTASLDLIISAGSDVVEKETKDISKRIAQNYLSAEDIAAQSTKSKYAALKSFFLLISAKVLLREGDKINSLKNLNEITSKYITSDEYAEAAELKKKAMQTSTVLKMPVVGVMISLTDGKGKKIESSKEVLEGIKYAFHEFNSSKDEKVGIIISDIERDEKKIDDAANNFILNEDVLCVIGPVFSDDVRTAIKKINRSNITLISPTATDDDLIDFSENFYQANPSLTSRGKTFAQYIYFVENKRSIAILNSIDGYSPLLAASFAQEFEKLGGKVVTKQTYKSKSYSLAEQISQIAAFAKSTEGIYAPISDKNDAGAILSQMAVSKLKLDVYGNQDWLSAKGIETAEQNGIKLTFDSDYFIDYNDEDFKKFSESFKKTTGIESSRNVLYGYDAGKYILTVIRNIDPTRINIKYKMESGLNVTGFHNNVSFDINRINKYINIVKYKDGVFELVDKFRSGK